MISERKNISKFFCSSGDSWLAPAYVYRLVVEKENFRDQDHGDQNPKTTLSNVYVDNALNSNKETIQ